MTADIITGIIIVFACYVIGSIPTAYLVVKKLKGIDIRTVGSGNVGASNAARVLGKWGFIGVFLGDAFKGYLPVFFLKSAYGHHNYVLIGAIAIVIGHSCTMFLKFKGGKGVATGVGIFLALAPMQVLLAAILFGLIVGIFQMVSLGSVTAAVFLAGIVWFSSTWNNLRYFTVVIALLIIYLHRGNLQRILRGEERKIGKRTS